jgi:hypothetical protein
MIYYNIGRDPGGLRAASLPSRIPTPSERIPARGFSPDSAGTKHDAVLLEMGRSASDEASNHSASKWTPLKNAPLPRTGSCHRCAKKALWDSDLFTLLDLRVSSLRRGHANLLCIVPMLTDDPGRESSLGRRPGPSPRRTSSRRSRDSRGRRAWGRPSVWALWPRGPSCDGDGWEERPGRGGEWTERTRRKTMSNPHGRCIGARAKVQTDEPFRRKRELVLLLVQGHASKRHV